MKMSSFENDNAPEEKVLFDGIDGIKTYNCVQNHFCSDEYDTALLSAIYTYLQNNENSSLENLTIRVVNRRRA